MIIDELKKKLKKSRIKAALATALACCFEE